MFINKTAVNAREEKCFFFKPAQDWSAYIIYVDNAMGYERLEEVKRYVSAHSESVFFEITSDNLHTDIVADAVEGVCYPERTSEGVARPFGTWQPKQLAHDYDLGGYIDKSTSDAFFFVKENK